MGTVARSQSLVRKRREELGLLLIELAERLQVSPSLVSFVEGGFVPKPGTQVAFAEALECSPIDLWPDEWEATGE